MGYGLWRLLTSVDFAVAQIIFLALHGRRRDDDQAAAVRSRSARRSDYASALDDIHARYDPLLGAGLVDALDRLSVFSIFRSPVVQRRVDRARHLDRRVHARSDPEAVAWGERHPGRPAGALLRPDPARSRGDGRGGRGRGVRDVLRRNGFRVREATADDGTRFLYGDRHQYTKMATLFTHAGLIVFLVAAAATSRLGQEQGLVVPEGRDR